MGLPARTKLKGSRDLGLVRDAACRLSARAELRSVLGGSSAERVDTPD